MLTRSFVKAKLYYTVTGFHLGTRNRQTSAIVCIPCDLHVIYTSFMGNHICVYILIEVEYVVVPHPEFQFWV